MNAARESKPKRRPYPFRLMSVEHPKHGVFVVRWEQKHGNWFLISATTGRRWSLIFRNVLTPVAFQAWAKYQKAHFEWLPKGTPSDQMELIEA